MHWASKALVAALAAAAVSPGAALACDCIRLIPGGPHFAEDVQHIADFYPVAAEGVIERDGADHWQLRTTREYRGPKHASYRIALISDCSIDPNGMDALVGKQVFALLVEGPGDHRGTYEMARCVNLQSDNVEKALRTKIAEGCAATH